MEIIHFKGCVYRVFRFTDGTFGFKRAGRWLWYTNSTTAALRSKAKKHFDNDDIRELLDA
jgi:hypothetical protein